MLLMGVHHTKEEMIARQMVELKRLATRYQRGSDAREDLIFDLECIQRRLEELEKVQTSSKEDYYV